ncbi:MAG: hypothetical protein CME37_19375 [Haliea sp.]|jgi:hypothetical protein|nr:hypothetical protein [Haliea sp.]|tara:strand:- start:4792 stop:5142 length:351 start_codon:yes stop_codon:yes gene_type:complete
MPCIRRRYHYAKVYIDDEAPELIGKLLVGTLLDVQLKNGDYKRVPFGGFLRDPEIMRRPIKIKNIEAYSDTGFYDSNWIEFGPEALALGSLIDNKAWFVVYRGFPLVWCELPIQRR